MAFGPADIATFAHKGFVMAHEHLVEASDVCAMCDALHAVKVHHMGSTKDWANAYLRYVQEVL